MKNAAAYIRVSTEDQTEYSPASQLEKICEYAKKNDYILHDEYIFIDEGISGRHTAKRAAFNRMIGIAKQKPKPFDAIILWKFSRFARNREDSIVYKSMLRKQYGIDVISVSENIGDNKMSVLIEALIEAMDEYYSINLSEEVKRGMAEKASRGEVVSIPSFGYNIENGKYVPDRKAAPIVRKIFYDFLNGKGMKTLASEINECGIRTRRGNRFESRTVKYILQNPVYIGKIRWTPAGKANYRSDHPDTMIIDGTHEAIIDTDIWNRAQDKINSIPKIKYMRHCDPKEPFMLQGLVRCSACGATLIRSSNINSLQCYAYSHGKCSTSHSITLNKLNDMFFTLFDNADVAGNFNLEPYPNKAQTKEKEDIISMIAREEKKLEKIRDAFENDVYTLQEYKDSRKKIMERINLLSQRQKSITLPDEQSECRRIRNKLQTLRPILHSPAVSESDKNSIIKSIVKQIVFYRSTGRIDVFFYT